MLMLRTFFVKFLTFQVKFKFLTSASKSSPYSTGTILIFTDDSFKKGSDQFVFISSENVIDKLP